jgi:pyruvate formate lyase activating enzyme
VNPEIPFHISRYFPGYRYSAPPTEQSFLREAYKIAKEKLPFVYLGNIEIHGASNSYCSNCSSLLIERSGYSTEVRNLDGQICNKCKKRQHFINEGYGLSTEAKKSER